MNSMYNLLKKLYPLNRTLVSDDNDKAMHYLNNYIPEMKILSIPTGTECWTWKIPEKWTVNEAYVSDGEKKLIDVKDHILHLMSYSLPKEGWVSKKELMEHITTARSYTADGGYRVPENENAIPWVMQYYERDWGFAVEKSKLKKFTNEKYYVKIDTEFEDGSMKIGELTIKGKNKDTIVIISDLCHPYQVNDSITGVVVAAEVAKELEKLKTNYTFQFLFLPETVGSIAYLSQNEKNIKNYKYGIFSEMLGHKNNFVLQYSKQKTSKIDRVAEYCLKKEGDYRTGDFRKVLQNDEGVFNGPGVNIPTISISRWPYPEYHTNLDNPSIIIPEQLEKSKDLMLDILTTIDRDYIPKRKFKGPVFLSGYGLWVDWRKHKKLNENLELIMMMLEGEHSCFDIAEKLEMDFDEVDNFLKKLYENNLITINSEAL